jgi:polyisoprenoid-binding protein YceI
MTSYPSLRALAALAALSIAACSPPSETAAPPTEAAAEAPIDVPAGAYKLEPAHATLLFKVDHLGFSHYTARFLKFNADLTFDPANPGASTLRATVDPKSLETDFPYPDQVDFNAELTGPAWLDAGQYPEIVFQSTGIELTGGRSAKIHGDLTLHGQTKPIVLDATFNGGYAGHPMDPNARIGFSATGSFNRSDFGIAAGIPAPGTTMGVSDNVDVILEVEFTGPPFTPPPAEAPAQ